MQSKEVINQTTSKFDRVIEIFKNISIFSGLFVGIGIAVFYLFGIAIYSTSTSILGVTPFEFNLQNCLKYGAASFVEIITMLPVLIVLGIADNLKEAGLSVYILFFLPLVFMFIHRILNQYTRSILRKIQNATAWLLLMYVSFLCISTYLALLSSYSTQNLLLDPSVNIALQHRDELIKSMDFIEFGIQDWDEWTANIVLRDEDWILGKIGALYSIVGLCILYGILAIKTYDKMLRKAQIRENKMSKLFVYSRRVFFGTFFVFLLGCLFVLPARTYVLSSLNKHKADVSIQGLDDITSKYYLVVVGNYEKSYALYNPNRQNVIVVQKDKVNYITLKEKTSIFSNRRFFRKTPWIGVNGQWKYSQDQNAGEQEESEILGFEVAVVYPDSPALKAKIMPGDILKKIGIVQIDGLQDLSDIVEQIPIGEPIDLNLMRNGQLITINVQMEIIP